MYYTYLVRPSGVPEGRGPEHRPFWEGLMNYNLRGGFALEILGTLLTMSCLNQKTQFIAPITIVGAVTTAVGALWIQGFRNVADDDGALRHTRGYRAGIKALNLASILDFISSTMTLVYLFSIDAYFDDQWPKERITSASIDPFSATAHLIHGVALILYATSIFLLESYHHEGTSDGWAWANVFLFKLAGILEILLYNRPLYFRLVLLLAMIIALSWAKIFEPLSHRGELKYTQGALQTELYKTKNAAAYYGRQ